MGDEYLLQFSPWGVNATKCSLTALKDLIKNKSIGILWVLLL